MVMHAYLMFKFLNLLLKMLDDHNKHNFFWVFLEMAVLNGIDSV